MANIVEYTLSLNDKISDKLSKIGIANNKQLEVWAGAQQKVNAANDAMSKCGRTIGSLQQRIDALKAERDWIPVENIQAIREVELPPGLVRENMMATGISHPRESIAHKSEKRNSLLTRAPSNDQQPKKPCATMHIAEYRPLGHQVIGLTAIACSRGGMRMSSHHYRVIARHDTGI